jgi:hypothetical protein
VVHRRRGIGAAVIVACAALLVAGVSSATAATEGPDPAPAGPADIAIPYADQASIEPQAPWRVASCADVRAASDLVASCDRESIVLSADEYDPDAGVTILPVRLTGSGRTMTVAYRITQEAPPAPTARAVTGRAIAAGALLRVPLSELDISCTVCADGGSTRVVEVDPAEAGSAWTTPTHVVFRASRDYRGDADIHVGIADDYGTEARTGIGAVVYPSTDELIAMDVAVPVDGKGRAEVDLTSLARAASGAEVVVVGCGGAVHGTVTCVDGTATYSGTGARDQFAFRVASGGDQAWGSVTLVEPDATAGLVPTSAGSGTSTAMSIIPPVPPEGGGETAGGLFRTFTDVLDRVGAR